MHVSIYLFIASLYIHDMNNALYVNHTADSERGLRASSLEGSPESQSTDYPAKITAGERGISFLHAAGLTTGAD